MSQRPSSDHGPDSDAAVGTLVRGGIVVRMRGSAWVAERADILVEGTVISTVGPDLRLVPGQVRRVIDASGCIVLPGLINVHTHSYATFFRGLFDRLTLEPWAVYATATTVARTRREGYVSAALAAVVHLRTGTTAVLDHLGGSLESQIGALEAYRDLGLRVAVARMVSDVQAHLTVPVDWERFGGCLPSVIPEVASLSSIRDEMEHLLGMWNVPDARVSVMLGPSGPQRCTSELLELCRDLSAAHGVGLHTHLLETRQQARFARETFGRSTVEELDRLGMLDARFSGAHAVWCLLADLRRLASAGVALVHNPWSNLVLGSGVANVPAWKEAGIVAALGTDGVNCGGNLNMFRAMSLAMVLHPSGADRVEDWPSVGDVLRMATAGGAAVLGASGRVGSLEPGYEADLVIVSAESTALVPEEGLLSQLVHGETAENVRTVLVAGQVVVEDRIIPTIDLSALIEEAREMSHRILARNYGLLRAADMQREALLDASRRAANAP